MIFFSSAAISAYRADAVVKRALDRLSHKPPLATAARMIKEAGNCKDDVLVPLSVKSDYTGSKKRRLVHGLPSPRYWYQSGEIVSPAVDLLYFFSDTPSQYIEFPNVCGDEELREWISEFSSRSFSQDLIAIICDEAAQFPSHVKYKLAQDLVLDLDRYAWYRGWSTLTLAKLPAHLYCKTSNRKI